MNDRLLVRRSETLSYDRVSGGKFVIHTSTPEISSRDKSPVRTSRLSGPDRRIVRTGLKSLGGGFPAGVTVIGQRQPFLAVVGFIVGLGATACLEIGPK